MLKKKEELLLKESEELDNKSNLTEYDKLSYGYNKFFFNECDKDLGIPIEYFELAKDQFRIYCINLGYRMKIKPALEEYYALYLKYGYISVSSGLIEDFLPEYEIVWTI